MKIAIIGAGVIGAATSYWLARAGHEVEILESAPRPGEGVSAGNGGQLAYAYVDPMAGPEIWASLPAILAGRDPSTRIRFSFDRDFLEWGLRFLLHCRSGAARRALLDLLALSRESQDAMSDLLGRHTIEFAHRKAGKLILYRDQGSLEKADAATRMKRDGGFALDVLDEAACRALEPALAQYPHPFAGGIHAPCDEVGDSGAFAREIIRLAREHHGALWRGDTIATGFVRSAGRVRGVATNRGDVAADAVVLAAGAQSRQLAADAGLRLPIHPVVGYSLTAPAGELPPRASITDRKARIVIAHIGAAVRIAGYADLHACPDRLDPRRAGQIAEIARSLFPLAARWDEAEPVWMGCRPMTPDSRPMIGPSFLPGLFLNVGYGGLGWTLACGGAARLARVIGPA